MSRARKARSVAMELPQSGTVRASGTCLRRWSRTWRSASARLIVEVRTRSVRPEAACISRTTGCMPSSSSAGAEMARSMPSSRMRSSESVIRAAISISASRRRSSPVISQSTQTSRSAALSATRRPYRRRSPYPRRRAGRTTLPAEDVAEEGGRMGEPTTGSGTAAGAEVAGAEVAGRIAAGYRIEGVAVELGSVVAGGGPHPDARVRVPIGMLNRHGLIAGATGTGKTKTLQLLTEQLSAAGVPVFVADVKGDLSGLAAPGEPGDRVTRRAADTGDDWQPTAYPVEFLAVGGIGPGVPLRATVTSFGPILLAKVLGLKETQES